MLPCSLAAGISEPNRLRSLACCLASLLLPQAPQLAACRLFQANYFTSSLRRQPPSLFPASRTPRSLYLVISFHLTPGNLIILVGLRTPRSRPILTTTLLRPGPLGLPLASCRDSGHCLAVGAPGVRPHLAAGQRRQRGTDSACILITKSRAGDAPYYFSPNRCVGL